MRLTQRQGKNNKSGKEKEDSAWQKGSLSLGFCLNNRVSWRKDQDKSHDHKPGQHHISVIHLEICIKEKHVLLPGHLFCFNWEGRKKTDQQEKRPCPPWYQQNCTRKGVPEQSWPRWQQPRRVCAELEPAGSSRVQRARLFTLSACIKVIFCLTWRRAGNPLLK